MRRRQYENSQGSPWGRQGLQQAETASERQESRLFVITGHGPQPQPQQQDTATPWGNERPASAKSWTSAEKHTLYRIISR